MAVNKQLANTQDLVLIDEIRNGTVILKNGGMRQVLMVSGLNTALKSEEELNLITSAYQNFLNSLDFPIQILVHSRKVNIDKYLNGLEERRRNEVSALLQSQISEYREFVAGFVKDNDIMEKTFLLVVPFSPGGLPNKETVAGITKFLPFLGRGGAGEKERTEKEATTKENLDQLGQRTSQVIDGLRAIELEVAVLNDQELVELFYNFYNPETTERQGLGVPVGEKKVEEKKTKEDND